MTGGAPGSTYPWERVDASTDPAYAALGGAPVGLWTAVCYAGRPNAVGSRTFRIDLSGADGTFTVLTGLRNHGAHAAMNWFEVAFYASGDGSHGSRDLRALALERPLFALLGSAVPPGGHLMVEYESPQQVETERALSLKVPPVLTALGSLLFDAGCGDWIRDWYIPEGWSEGPRKLQGFRAFDDEHRARRHAELRGEIERFLAMEPPGQPILLAARARAPSILSRLYRA